jgi:NAD(P)-dependent dehydrogenase (short-subunit alcohol dehydrogenase family)
MTVTLDYSGCEVLVTGGSHGIGQAIAGAFRRAGASVAITGTRPSPDDYDTDLGGFGYRQVLMEDGASVDELIAATDRVDILVNNAGTYLGAPEGLSPEGFEKNMAINLNSVFRLSQGLRGALSERPGCIINIASMYSYFGCGHGPAYGASKAAIVNLTMSLAALYASDGIRVNAIAPGWIRTKLTIGAQANEARSRVITARTPMARWGEAEEVAGTALYLASNDLAGFVTGATIPVDGGYSTA